MFVRRKPWLMLTPALLFLLLPLYGLWSALWNSLTPDGEVTLRVYSALFSNTEFLFSFFYSMWIALISTILSLMIGWLMTRFFLFYLENTGGKLAVWLPMIFPHFVWAYLILLLFREGGVISGFLPGDPAFANDPQGIGIILTYLGKEIPFVILMLLPVYLERNRAYDDLVETLGGSFLSRIKDAEWPFIAPVLIETGLIIFAFTFSAYEVPALVGATFPEMISVFTYDWFYSGDWSERPLAFAAMVSSSAFIGIVAWILLFFMNKKRRNITEGL
ncbi:putative spermidine/putrescine transport system permease protein [Salimicrobium flavidum]|uniref:Putative spermidine/putrescine transport system permease protein n=1 Tax=Salimicrobium flavidum TaxID=570947 RepID=A0A1N7J969_9BACI|nr:putative spermidine/putrescine transport system permease protein [Salimicrobium flavidum]